MIGMEPDGHPFLHAIREGAMGYVAKGASVLEVVAAVRKVVSGGALCSPELRAFLFLFATQQNQMPCFYLRTRPRLTIGNSSLFS